MTINPNAHPSYPVGETVYTDTDIIPYTDSRLLVKVEREACAKLCDEAARRLRLNGCGHEASAVEDVADEIRNARGDGGS